MSKKIIVVGDDGDIRIIIKKSKENKEESRKSELVNKEKGTIKNKVIIPEKIVQQMEIRAESVFRPSIGDVETAYALSGIDVIDMLHKFTTEEIIIYASPLEIYTITEQKVKYILEERVEMGKPNVIVDVHTHPEGVAELSEVDRRVNKKAYKIFKKHFSKVYFGIHAVSKEIKLKRTRPTVDENRRNVIKWNSIRRKHEVAFFDVDGKPVEVEIW